VGLSCESSGYMMASQSSADVVFFLGMGMSWML